MEEHDTDAKLQVPIKGTARITGVVADRAFPGDGPEPLAPPIPWIAVADRLPGDGVRVLIFVRGYGLDIAHLGYDREWCGAGWTPFDAVTHWMPLPPLPEVES